MGAGCVSYLVMQLLPLHICPSNPSLGALGGLQDVTGALYGDIFDAVERLPEVHMKTLNMAREWLCSLLPHALQKANRVKSVSSPTSKTQSPFLLVSAPILLRGCLHLPVSLSVSFLCCIDVSLSISYFALEFCILFDCLLVLAFLCLYLSLSLTVYRASSLSPIP